MIGHMAASTAARRSLAVMFLAILAALGLAGSAHAQDDGPDQSIRGRVFNESEEDGERARLPVAGVRIVVATEAGEDLAEGVTGEDGAYDVPLAEPGTYVVRIDEGTLPEELAVQEGQGEATVTVRAGQSATRVFFLGENLRQTEGKLSQLPQTLANGLKLAMIIAITSVGLSLIFGTTGLSNFSHGEMVTFGAIVAFWFNQSLGWHLIPAAVAAAILSGVLGYLYDKSVWRPLRGRTSLTSLMIISIGIALAARYLFLYFFGADVEAYRQYTLQSGVDIGPITFTPRSLWVMALALGIILGVAFFLLRARFGKAIRAVSDNPDLASSTGIDTNRVIAIVWTLGGALAGIGGVFYGLEFQVRWDMGFTLLLMMFAAITLGGLGNPFGALFGSLVIGVFVELWTWIVPNANDLKTVGALIALILVLLVRPQGLLGTKERVG